MKRISRLRQFALFVTLPVTTLLVWTGLSRAQEQQRAEYQTVASEAIGAVSIAANVYAQEHQGRLPVAANWEQALQPNTGPISLQLPSAPGAQGRRIAFNRSLAGRALKTIALPHAAVVFFVSTSAAPNVCDELTSLPSRTDSQPLTLAFADGHLENNVPVARRDEILTRSRNACFPLSH